MEINDQIQQILDTLPDKPGCYLMKNANGKIIYVGKAINLRNRVRSYFHSTAQIAKPADWCMRLRILSGL